MASAKKTARKIAAKTIERAMSQANRGPLFDRVEESNLARLIDGKDALSSLRKLKGAKLKKGDEKVIARHLFDEVRHLQGHLRAQGDTLGDFSLRAKIDQGRTTKELNRLMLAPGKDSGRGRGEVSLRRGAEKYTRLIDAIAKETKEGVGILADRVLRGTSLNPFAGANLTGLEKLQAVLQALVDQMDAEFQLSAKFAEVARLKVEHLMSGGEETWPLWLYEREELPALCDERFAFWPEPSGDIDRLFNGWPISSAMGIHQDVDFFYVPHAPFGLVEYVNLPSPSAPPSERAKATAEMLRLWQERDESGVSAADYESSVEDRWNEEKQEPFGQLEFPNGTSKGTFYSWLVIYPMPVTMRLMPMLYTPCQEGGPAMLPLDVRNLSIMNDMVWFDGREHKSALERLKDLLGYRPGTRKVIQEGWRRTCPWLDHNPFFKMKRQRETDAQRLDELYREVLGGGA